VAFNNEHPADGPFVLSAGSSVGVWITFNDGDRGAQWIMADPIGPGMLTVTGMTKERKIQVPNQLVVVYSTSVTNSGNDSSIFTIQGGGNV
jgi:hypothetical protein